MIPGNLRLSGYDQKGADRMQQHRRCVKLFGVLFDDVSLNAAAARTKEMVRRGPYHYCVGTNADLLRRARRDAGYRDTINGADLSLADGAGVILAARILGEPLTRRVPCIDLLETLLTDMDGARVYILGGKPGTAEKAVDSLRKRYPKIVFCGSHHGYFQEPETMAREIAACAPDLLLVCLGSPKQELFMAGYGYLTGAKLAVGAGGWVDIASGRLRRAPQTWQKLDLEWVWRFLHEPWRIGRVLRSLTLPFLAWGERIRSQFPMIKRKKKCQKSGTDEKSAH